MSNILVDNRKNIKQNIKRDMIGNIYNNGKIKGENAFMITFNNDNTRNFQRTAESLGNVTV